MKELADNNFEFDENGGKFSETVENTVGKGKIVCYEQLLPFPQSFKKTCKVLLQTRKTRACLEELIPPSAL